MQHDSLLILGHTASGKTKLAVRAALALNGEIISIDSRQVYKEMDIGTGKDLDDYSIGNQTIPLHLINMLNAGERYNVNQFKLDAEIAFNQITNKSKVAIFCGGTGMYMDAIMNNFQFAAVPVNEVLRLKLQPKSKQELLQQFNAMPHTNFTSIADTSTSKRIIRAIEINEFLIQFGMPKHNGFCIHPFIIGLDLPLETRRKRIAERLEMRLQNGLIEEVEQLLKKLTQEQLMYYGLEYKFITMYLLGIISREALTEQLTIAIQQYAKRQMTYFRKMERDGKKIYWIDATQPLESQVDEALKLFKTHSQFEI